MAAARLPAMSLDRPAELERALADDCFFIHLLDFCKQEHNAENILFWRDVGDLQAFATKPGDPGSDGVAGASTDPAQEQVVNAQLALARAIMAKFVRIGAAHEINMPEEKRSELARAVQAEDISSVRAELAALRNKALKDIHTDIVPRFRKSEAFAEACKERRDRRVEAVSSTAALASSPIALALGASFGARRATIGTAPSVDAAHLDRAGLLQSASSAGPGDDSSPSASPTGSPSSRRGSARLTEQALAKAVRHVRRRRRVLGLSLRVKPSANAIDAIADVVSVCKANPLREGFLHKRGGGRQSWKRRWCVLTKDIGASFGSDEAGSGSGDDDGDGPSPTSPGKTSRPMLLGTAERAGEGGVPLETVPGMPSHPAAAASAAAGGRSLEAVGDGRGGSVDTAPLAVEWLPARTRSGALLLYFDDDKDPLPKGIVPLSGVCGLAPDLGAYVGGTLFSFGLVTKERLFVLHAVSERTLHRWLDAFRLVLGLPLSSSAAPLAGGFTPRLGRTGSSSRRSLSFRSAEPTR
ncbi:hypothetical protein FNF29_04372 [Cafeteria roenbergensis]|uniref:RGS domain-containing protein n=1 Tax=Cafeteria roenbergensis TaxID=33653 RepID=A0A5A8CF98_CAFRO|nr:hypothetical protein FNF29_04372 [Cafeteria roenbergensis]|eukprot:KAA0151686.1 hypothetical protein FNF29_04372 [Cafeteria roenbergensis]